MNDIRTMKIVDFRYCKKCKHGKKREDEEPCDDCLNEPAREYSERPIHYEEAEAKSQRKHDV